MGEILRPFGDEPDKTLGEDRPIYRPQLQFEEFGLVVGFDHALQANPEEFNDPQRRPKAATYFVVDPQRELYFGLRFVPRRVLEEVARGLETYLEDETLEDEHKALITHGVFRLNKFFATGSLESK